jgi:hypothetical protein
MSEPSLDAKLLLVAGFFVSLAAFLWLLSLRAPVEMFPRLGFISALYCTSGALAFCWATFFAFLARKHNWPARLHTLPGLLFLIPATLLLFDGFRFMSISMLLISQSFLANYICRRLAYPNTSPEQIYAAKPPLSLFTK